MGRLQGLDDPKARRPAEVHAEDVVADGKGDLAGTESSFEVFLFSVTNRTVSVHRVLQMRGGGYADVLDVLPVLQVPDNKADAVPCERLPKKGKGTMKKKEKAERPIIISYRRRCVSDVTGTGLSHYIMFEDEE